MKPVELQWLIGTAHPEWAYSGHSATVDVLVRKGKYDIIGTCRPLVFIADISVDIPCYLLFENPFLSETRARFFFIYVLAIGGVDNRESMKNIDLACSIYETIISAQ